MGIRLVCCWPGLAALWYRGQAWSLLVSVLFAWTVCLLLLATFVWPEWWHLWVVRLLWLGVLTVGLISCVLSHLRLPQLLGRSDAKSDRQFEQAQQEYLRGNWFEAEAMLLDLLQRFPRDIQAGLLLVGVLRHTQRWQPALRRLDQLQLIDGAQGWHFEIQRERQLIEKRRSERIEQEAEA